MTPPGVDLGGRVPSDPLVGPVIAVGLGGTPDLVGDEEPRLAPLSLESALALVAGSRAAAALEAAGLDRQPVVELVVRTAQLAAEHPEITGLELNPVIVTASGCRATDVAVRVAPHAPGAALRRLEH
jgi:hypothetical protein